MNAAYFSLALVAGTKLGNVMAGRNLKSVFSSTNAGSLIDKSKVWAPLRPLRTQVQRAPPRPTSAMNSRRSSLSSAKAPVIFVVTIDTPSLRTPRVHMQ